MKYRGIIKIIVFIRLEGFNISCSKFLLDILFTSLSCILINKKYLRCYGFDNGPTLAALLEDSLALFVDW